MKIILGKKLGMTRVFGKDGKAMAATVVEAGPCYITQIKNKEKDGYNALQIGYKSVKYLNKPEKGHLEKNKIDKINFLQNLKECRVKEEEISKYKIGDEIKIDLFKPGDKVNISGVSKGKGFQGTVKRHNFTTGPKTHGSDNYRQPGSIGATYPQRTIKGKRMSGHMGCENVSVKNLEIIDVILEQNLLLIYGAVPGIVNNFITIKGVNNE